MVVSKLSISHCPHPEYGRQRFVRSPFGAIEKAIAEMVHASENGDDEVLESFQNAYQPVLNGMLETLNRLRINFDEFTKESLFVTNGDVGKIMQKL